MITKASDLQRCIGSLILSCLLFHSLSAQPVLRSAPPPAAKVPEYDVSLGYIHLVMNDLGVSGTSLNGVDASAGMNFNARWGVTTDINYARRGNDPLSAHSAYVLSAQGGPVFTVAESYRGRIFIRALGGVSVVDGSVPVGELYYRGWLSRFSWAIGTGLEHRISGPFSFLINADYLQTKFINQHDVAAPQNDVRLSASVVLHLRSRDDPQHFAPKIH